MNSLTANNRLSQQLVVSVAEHLLLRHECRLPNHLAVSNHRELYHLRKDYPHECFSPLWKFRRDFVECEGPPAH
nr:DUF4222 domain-containing protein [Escherichia coli]